jgi:hypothetical protein
MAARAHASHAQRLAELAGGAGTVSLQKLENAVRRFVHTGILPRSGNLATYAFSK